MRLETAALILFFLVLFSCTTVVAGDDVVAEANSVYLDSIGWKVGKCAAVPFSYGLTKDCDVQPQTGAGANPPMHKMSGEKDTGSPITLKCEDQDPKKGILIFELVLDATFRVMIKVRFEDGVPISMNMSVSSTLYRENLHLIQAFDLTDPKDDLQLADVKTYMGLFGNIDQFICHGPAKKYERYQKLLTYNRSQLPL